uniref:Uncharacterized protein n=1 Tax=Timema bartmani TaxID=61472 RepID=A0A7R9HZP8_9NEOP|nr:unnamed protein product [Timema bartmani]
MEGDARKGFLEAGTLRQVKSRDKRRIAQYFSLEKDLGFLRIGSLNMRVKKTTEAFSNFLGVGTPSSDKLHKTWGSADNIQQVEQVMQPPKFAPVKRRRPKRPQDIAVSHSTPSTPPSQTRSSIVGSVADSDSDNACGFDSNWKGTV